MIRSFRKTDTARLEELHRLQGFEYALPDLSDARQFAVRLVATDGTEAPHAAVLARVTVELFYLADPQHRTPRWRFETFRRLHEQMRLKLASKGITDAHLWVPPVLEKSFARRLKRGFGWRVNRWLCLSRPTARLG